MTRLPRRPRVACLLAAAGCLLSGVSARGAAIALTESTFTEIVKEANVIAAATKTETRAATGLLFKSPDLVRTGRESRVELTAKDNTITRIGANTVFTFAQNGRDINLHEGSVLFHSPKGAGGGAIKNRGTSAAVLGTTEIAAVMPDRSFKVMNLEGTVKVTLRNGQFLVLKPGQMVVVSPDGKSMSEAQNFNLAAVAPYLELVTGFQNELASLELIKEAAREQSQQIADGAISNLVSSVEAGYGFDLGEASLTDVPNGPWNGDSLAERTSRDTGQRPAPFISTAPIDHAATVTNINQPPSGGGYDVSVAKTMGMSFTVGNGATAWSLDNVQLRLATNGPGNGDLTVRIHADAAGMVGAPLGSFIKLDPFGPAQTYTFIPDKGITLNAGQTYWITATSSGPGYFWLSTSGSIIESGLPGWVIGDGLAFGNLPGVDTGTNPLLPPAMVAVNATPVPEIPEPAAALMLTLTCAGLTMRRRR